MTNILVQQRQCLRRTASHQIVFQDYQGIDITGGSTLCKGFN